MVNSMGIHRYYQIKVPLYSIHFYLYVYLSGFMWLKWQQCEFTELAFISSTSFIISVFYFLNFLNDTCNLLFGAMSTKLKVFKYFNTNIHRKFSDVYRIIILFIQCTFMYCFINQKQPLVVHVLYIHVLRCICIVCLFIYTWMNVCLSSFY